jgi:hypothetical protein
MLAGIPIERLTRFDDLRAEDLAVLAAALFDKRLPLAFTLHVDAANPAGNGVAATLAGLDWRLLVSDRETIRGRFDRRTQLPEAGPQSRGSPDRETAGLPKGPSVVLRPNQEPPRCAS